MGSGFGGFARGAAAVAVPMLLEQEKEEQIKVRDQRLADLQAARDKQLKIDRAEEAREQRKFERSENRKTREHSESLSMAQIAAQQADSARRQEQGERQIGLSERQVEIAERAGEREGETFDINKQIAEMSLEDKKRIRDLTETMLDDTAPDAARMSAMDSYRLLTNQEGKIIQVGGGQEWDENAGAMRNLPTRLFDTTTRQFIEYGGSNPLLQTGGESQYKTKEEIGEAYRAGKLTRAQAEEMLRRMQAFE